MTVKGSGLKSDSSDFFSQKQIHTMEAPWVNSSFKKSSVPDQRSRQKVSTASDIFLQNKWVLIYQVCWIDNIFPKKFITRLSWKTLPFSSFSQAFLKNGESKSGPVIFNWLQISRGIFIQAAAWIYVRKLAVKFSVLKLHPRPNRPFLANYKWSKMRPKKQK